MKEKLTTHSSNRKKQRGFSDQDIEDAITHGICIRQDSGVNVYIYKGYKVVYNEQEDVVITVMHNTKRLKTKVKPFSFK